MSRSLFFYSDSFLTYELSPEHPLKPQRLQMTYELLDAYGAFESGLRLAEPAPAPREEVLTAHSEDYICAVEALSSGRAADPYRFGFGTGDNPVFSGMYEASLGYAGASLDAANAVIDGGCDVAINISGGLHHAHFARAAGFCIFNDPVIAIRRLRRKFARVAYVDIDVHHGDGVQEAFYSDPTVLTISIHESGQTLFPGTGFVSETGEADGEGYSVNVPLAPDTTDDVWLSAWRGAGLPILRAFRPDVIFLQMGTDAHWMDPLGNLCLTAQGWLGAVQDVRALIAPIVAVGGGGYCRTTVPRMWALATAALSGLDLPDTVPETYAHRMEIPALTDREWPHVGAGDAHCASAFAEDTATEVKSRLFAKHGLLA